MRQVTLIALYGQKPFSFLNLITDCQARIKKVLPDIFIPYHPAQIHGTVVGLERVNGSAFFNLNLVRYRNKEERMDFEGLLNFIRNSDKLPFQVQIGGFQDRDYSFVSRGQNPYRRSFSVQGDKVVLMGWPVQGKHTTDIGTNSKDAAQERRIYPQTLDDIRKAVQEFGLLHAYHRKITDIDNDFYFKIGSIRPNFSLDRSTKQALVDTMRQFLSRVEPIDIKVSLSDVYVASYRHETLPPNSTRWWSVCDDVVTPAFIESLYE